MKGLDVALALRITTVSAMPARTEIFRQRNHNGLSGRDGCDEEKGVNWRKVPADTEQS